MKLTRERLALIRAVTLGVSNWNDCLAALYAGGLLPPQEVTQSELSEYIQKLLEKDKELYEFLQETWEEEKKWWWLSPL